MKGLNNDQKQKLFARKKSNQIIKTTLYNQKLIHEKYENLKADSDTIIKKQLQT